MRLFVIILMYNLYGKFIGEKIFKLSQTNGAPADEMRDGVDYVPTRKEIIFGHHFTSIADSLGILALLILGVIFSAFVNGAANMIASTGFPNSLAGVIMGEFVE